MVGCVSFCSRVGTLLVRCALAGFVCALPQVVLAQIPKEGGAGIAGAATATEPSWVFPYFLIVLSAGLGVWIIAKPSRRKDPDEKEDRPA